MGRTKCAAPKGTWDARIVQRPGGGWYAPRPSPYCTSDTDPPRKMRRPPPTPPAPEGGPATAGDRRTCTDSGRTPLPTKPRIDGASPKERKASERKTQTKKALPGPPRLRPSGSRMVSEHPPGTDERNDGGQARGPAQGDGRHWPDGPPTTALLEKGRRHHHGCATSHAHHRQRGGRPCPRA